MGFRPPRPWSPGDDGDEAYPGERDEGPEAMMARDQADFEALQLAQDDRVIEALWRSLCHYDRQRVLFPFRIQQVLQQRRIVRRIDP
jgi:hypothetical protein